MTTAEMILAGRHQAGEDVDPMEAEDAALAAGYAKAREFSNALGYDGDSYADYLAGHDRELAARGYAPRPCGRCACKATTATDPFRTPGMSAPRDTITT